jgi:arabinoxylan arabinofuranohydrolase
MKMGYFRKHVVTLIVASIGFSAFAQNPDTSVLALWEKNDVKFDSPKAANPLLPGYFADPTIIEDKGTFYVYATSDMPSWNDITKLAVWSSKDFVNWKCQYLNWPTKERYRRAGNMGWRSG